jgi:hypothetical protein
MALRRHTALLTPCPHQLSPTASRRPLLNDNSLCLGSPAGVIMPLRFLGLRMALGDLGGEMAFWAFWDYSCACGHFAVGYGSNVSKLHYVSAFAGADDAVARTASKAIVGARYDERARPVRGVVVVRLCAGMVALSRCSRRDLVRYMPGCGV